MSTIEQQLAAWSAPTPPADEVLSIERASVESILTELEANDPLRPIVTYLRARLAEPKVELWAIHSVGPAEEYPCLDKEDAERRARELRAMGDQMKAELLARGESVKHWNDWVTNVIPSPWEPAEHFEIMAREWMEDADQVREHASKLKAQRDDLLADLREAAATLRRYETLHRAKGTDDSTAKAEVNAALATQFEATIAKATE